MDEHETPILSHDQFGALCLWMFNDWKAVHVASSTWPRLEDVGEGD